MVVTIPGDATDLFPPFVSEINGALVRDLVFDHLADIGPELSTINDVGFTPRLAKSWTWAPDSMSIAFSLDPKARWHDGKPVTAADVKYSYTMLTDPKVGSSTAPLLANIDSVAVRDSMTAVFFFKKHTPEQFYDVAYQIYVVPQHVYGKIPLDSLRTSELTRHPVGSGRFRFVQWQPDVKIELISDTANYKGRAKLDRVILSPVPEPAAGRAQVLTGQSDFMAAFPGAIQELDSSKIARPIVAPQIGYTFFGMNPYKPKTNRQPHPVFSDIRVRRALSMAVDRVGMLRNVFGDKGLLAHGPFPMAVSSADSTIVLPPFDTTHANALLDSAGWKRGSNGVRARFGVPLRFSILTPTTSAFRQKYAVLLQDQFRRVGAQVDIDQADGKTFMARMKPAAPAGEFDAMLMSFNPDPDIGGAKESWSTAAMGGEGKNWLRYSNHKVDLLLDSAVTIFDEAKAKAISKRAYQLIADDVPAIWLFDVVYIDAINRRIEPTRIWPTSWWLTLPDWSIPPDKRIDRDRIGLGSSTQASAKP